MEEVHKEQNKDREFICSCGKGYLSYAALFTHIKNKHNGQAPGPIVRPRSERKRGRPKKNSQVLPSEGQDQRIMGLCSYSSPNKKLLEGQFQFIQSSSHKDIPAEEKTIGGSSFLHTSHLPSFNTCRPHSAFSFYNSQFTQNSLQRLRSQNIHQKGKKTKENQNDSDSGMALSEKNTPRTFCQDFIQTQLLSNSIISRVKQLCSELTQNQTEKIVETLIRSNSLKVLIDNFSEDKNIINIHKFLCFLKNSLEQHQLQQITLVFTLYLDFIIQTQIVAQDKLPDSVNNFLESYWPHFLRQKELSQVRLFNETNTFKIFLQLFNWLGIQQYEQFIEGQISSLKLQAERNKRDQEGIITEI